MHQGEDSNSLQFRGLAPQAKIAFTDISTGSSGAFTGPADIIAYMDTARTQWSSSIIVGAFGSTAPVTWYAITDPRS